MTHAHRSTIIPLDPGAWIPWVLCGGLLAGLGLPACSASQETLGDAGYSIPRSATDISLASVSLAEQTTCITTRSGQAKCWGQSDSSSSIEAEPAEVPFLELGARASTVVTDGMRSYALLDNGTVLALGVVPPFAPIPLASLAYQLVAGEDFACALLDDGRVQCWGRGDEGQLGRTTSPGSHPPGDVVLGGSAVELTAGVAHACARLVGGTIRCWGLGDQGQLGYGRPVSEGELPSSTGDVILGGLATQVVAGGAHTCARLVGGTIRCWGLNDHGQLGYGHMRSVGDDEHPATAGDVALGGSATMVTAGISHTCALLEDATLRCWGEGSSKQLGLSGTATIGDDELPGQAPLADFGGHAVERIFMGALAEHGCALLNDGALRCWGLNDHGQLGLGFTHPQEPLQGPPGDLPDVIIVEDPDA